MFSGGAFAIVARRLALMPVQLFIILAVTFALTQIAPGDPVRIIGGSRAVEPEQAERIREEFGLNGGYVERFGEYVVGLVTRGDLGPSYYYRAPKRTVQELLGSRIWASMQINLIVFAVIYSIGIPLGVFTATRRGTWLDPFTIGFFKLFDSIPSPIFIVVVAGILVEALGPVTRFFGFNFPAAWVSGDPASYAIPVIALSLPALGGIARFVRVSMLTVMDDDYVRTAHAKGLTDRRVIYGHVLRNALLPLAYPLGMAVVGVIGGSIVVETRYGVPGIGAFMFDSITQRDFNVVLGFTILTSALLVAAFAIIDIAYIYLDPRIRFTARAT